MARTPRLKFDIMAHDKTGQAFSALQDKVRRTEQRLASAQKQFMAVAAAATLLGGGLAAIARQGAAQIDEVAKAARRVEASVGGFRALQLAASEAGVPISALPNEIQNINRELANIGISGNGQRALDRLGMSAADLAGLDADEKVARIADAVNRLGLSSGEATAILRDLGVRNREMVLLLGQGGDAIRNAARDITDYGLALSDVDAGRIEEANDAIGRLGLVGQYASQRIALELVPAMGRFADAMTDSLREGGRLRGMIDGLADNLLRVSTYVGTAVTLFGVRYVAALVAARVATFTLAGSLTVLRGALLRTVIGALVVGAGELVYQFGRLISATGSFGGALGILKDVAVEVFGRIKDSFALVPLAVQAGSNAMAAFFLDKLSAMLQGFAQFTQSVANGLNALFGTSLSGIDGVALTDGIELQYIQAFGAAREAEAAMAGLAGSLTAPLQSLAALQTTVTDAANEIADSGEAAGQLSDELDGVAGAGSSAGGALDELTEEVERFNDETRRGIDAVSDFFMAIGAGGNAALDVIKRLVLEMAKVQITRGLETLAGASSGVGGFFDFLGGLLTNANGNAFSGGRVIPFADGGVVTGPTLFPMAGRSTGLMGEAGAEAIMPLKRGADGKLGVAASGGGGGKSITMNMSIDARGADPSVVPRIEQALAQIGPMIDARLRHPDIRYGG